MVEITLNGEARAVAEGTTVRALLDELGAGDRGVAVAVDAEVVPRSAWETQELRSGEAVEVLVAVQGG
jgi:sulfur carrier protein